MIRKPSWKYPLFLLISVLVAFCNGGGEDGSSEPQVISLDPEANALAALADSIIMATFSQSMNSGDSSTFVVHGSMSGKLPGTYSGGGSATLAFDPNNIFKPGEEVEVTLTAGLTATDGVSLASPLVYRFLTEVGGTGNANFVSTAIFAVGDTPRSLTAGDLDGDADLDLAVANQNGFDVTVLLNDGSGGFSEAAGSPVAVGNQPRDITTSDFDGDEDLDLAVANFFDNNVTVLLNDGSAGFSEAAGSPFSVGVLAASLTTGDLDGDGDLDLTVVNLNDNNVTVLLNDGSAGFSEAAGSPFSVGNLPQAITTGDLDGDGDLDLIVTDTSGPSLTVLLNDSDGDFSEAPGSPIVVGAGPLSLTAKDLDGDGDLDLTMTNRADNNVTVLLNDGSAGFSEAAGSPFSVGNLPQAITTGDMDEDGDLDLAVAIPNTNLELLINQP
jgi:hypothetical protein